MTRDELRAKILDGIDRALQHTWVVSRDEQHLLRAVAVVVKGNDSFVDAINAALPVTREELSE